MGSLKKNGNARSGVCIMGILLGKSSDTLTNFEVTNQQPSFQSFRNVNRSINKAAQIYQFKEKGQFDLEFNYMTNSDYQALSHILRNRNSLRDGLIFQPIPYAGDASTICDFSGEGYPHKAYKSYGTTIYNIPGGKTEISTGEYDNINVFDGASVTQAAVASNYSAFLLKFNLTDFFNAFSLKELRRLTLVIYGMRQSPISFYVYDQVGETWYNIVDRYENNSDMTVSDFYLNRQLVAQLSTPWGANTLYDNYCLDYTVTFMIVGQNLNTAMTLQFARLFVNGYWVGEDESGGFEAYATAFTGAGRSGSLKLMEL